MPPIAKIKAKTKNKRIARKTTGPGHGLRGGPRPAEKQKQLRRTSRPTKFSLWAWAARPWARLQEFFREQPELVGLGVVMFAAALLRLIRPDWYVDRQFHPDERWIFGVVSQLSYPKEPTALQYGTFPLYLLAMIKDVAATLAGWFGPFDANQFVIWAGRTLSGLFDLGTVALAYLIGCRLLPAAAGRRVGLLAAAFLAFTVLHIQMSHFFVVDVPLATLTLATIYFSIRIAQDRTQSDYLWAGVCLGLAAATKTSAAPLAITLVLGHAAALLQAKPGDRVKHWQDFGMGIGAAAIAFFAAMPYAFLDWDKFWGNQNEQQRILVTGLADVPYNRQYLHTLPFLYYIKNLARYGMGQWLGWASILAFVLYPIVGIYRSIQAFRLQGWKKLWSRIFPHSGLIILLGFGWIYFAIIGMSFAKFNRYLLPLTPIFCILVGHAAYWLYGRMSSPTGRRLVLAGIALVLGAAICWSLAFASIYRNEHPWIAASRWIQTQFPDRVFENGFFRPTAILNEEWGDDLPTYVKGIQPKTFQMHKFSVQEPDDDRKHGMILDLLQTNDLIVMADTRAHAVYRRLPDRYPMNAAYYELMFEEKLGFKLAAEFKNYPHLLGLEFRDDQADESFTLYDHPHVFLFRRELPGLPAQELAQRLDTRIAEIKTRQASNRPPPEVAPISNKPMALPKPVPAGGNLNVGASQGRPIFILGHVNGLTAGLAWILLLELLGLLCLPLCLSLFPRLPDSGVALAKILGTLIFTWVVWLLVSAGIMQHRQATSALVLLVLAGASLAWAKQRQEEIRKFIRERGALWLTAEIIFLAAFVGYMLTKCYNPDIKNPFGQGYNGGGEPMGVSFFTAVYQSIHFPPYDPWLSGYSINYYYYGQVILGILAKVLGVPPQWAYQICISLLFALTMTGVYGLGLALTNKRRWGVLAASAAVLFGNLHTFFYLLEPFNRGIHWNDMLTSLGQIIPDTLRHAGRFEFLWNPTRLIKGTINEMPWFSFLYGDLHAHIIAIPYSLPLIGWGLNLLLPGRDQSQKFPEAPGRTGLERGMVFFTVALCLGSLACINTWNFPPYALLVLGVLLVQALALDKGRAFSWKAVGSAGLAWLRLLIVGVLLFFFFHKNFKPQSTSLAFVNPEVRSHVKEFLEFFGLGFFSLMSFWAMLATPALRDGLKKCGWSPASRKPWYEQAQRVAQQAWKKFPLVVYLLISVAAGLLIMLLFNQMLLAILTLLLVAAFYFYIFWPLTPQLRMTMLLAVLGLGISWGCELVHVKDFMGVGGDMSRMNTVFKFYMIAWIYWALVATVCLSQVLEQSLEIRRAWLRWFSDQEWWRVPGMALGVLLVWGAANYFQETLETPYLSWVLAFSVLGVPWIWAWWPKRAESRGLWAACLAAMLLVVGLYPPISLYNRMKLCSEFQHPTLNGFAYLDRMLPAEAKALQWIREQTTANDVILEMPGVRGYNCFDTRVAIFTGHPTLIGWVGQEEQMRYNPELTGSHTRDADQIYQTPDAGFARRLMEQYQVEYVFVGENEHKAYSSLGLQKFPLFMDMVYNQDGVQIFRKR